MSALVVTPNVDRPDDLYQRLVDAHDGLTDGESALLNAKLVLLLANHIGDEGVLAEAIAAARAGLDAGAKKRVVIDVPSRE